MTLSSRLAAPFDGDGGCSAMSSAGPFEAAVEEVVEAADFPGDDLLRRSPRGRPERREAAGRVDHEVAIGGSAGSDEHHDGTPSVA
jgi:hypothetical protein